MARDEDWIPPPVMRSAANEAIDAAIARGDFDDLALAGKPLSLPAQDDPDWWIRQRIEDGDIDRNALLPAVVLLRREADDLDTTLAALDSEQAVRDYAEDYTSRVLRDRVENPLTRMFAPTLDADIAVERWRTVRQQ